MTQRNNNAGRSPTISDERIRNVLRRELHRAINIDRIATRAELEEQSGVSVHQIDQIMTRDAAKQRRVTVEDAFSLAEALGDRCIQALIGTLGYVGRPRDGADPRRPMAIVAKCMGHLSTIADAAADDHIDHVEAPDTTEAADMIIVELTPLSSLGKRQ